MSYEERPIGSGNNQTQKPANSPQQQGNPSQGGQQQRDRDQRDRDQRDNQQNPKRTGERDLDDAAQGSRAGYDKNQNQQNNPNVNPKQDEQRPMKKAS